MMREVTKEIAELASLKGIKEVDLKDSFTIYGDTGSWQCGNRGTEMAISRALGEARDAKRIADAKAALAAKLASGAAVWRKIGAEWLAQVTGRDISVGDMIEVERKSGERSKQIVRAIVSRSVEGIYCRV